MIRFNGGGWQRTGGPICPDLARLEFFGEADNLRGRVVRLFFRILDRLWPVPSSADIRDGEPDGV